VGVASERRTGAMIRGGPRVVVLAYPGADLLDVAGPCAVFDAFEHAPGRSEEDTAPGYRVEVVSTGGGSRVETSCRVALVAERDYLSVRGQVDTLLVAGGDGAWRAARDERLQHWLRRMAPRARRIGSVCTGAFVLAAARLLDGRRATTHWQLCPRLARDRPAVAVEEDPIFVRDGNVYTSAGIDLTLALVDGVADLESASPISVPLDEAGVVEHGPDVEQSRVSLEAAELTMEHAEREGSSGVVEQQWRFGVADELGGLDCQSRFGYGDPGDGRGHDRRSPFVVDSRSRESWPDCGPSHLGTGESRVGGARERGSPPRKSHHPAGPPPRRLPPLD
jgi:putative intracellular protease/amidase